VHAVWIIALEIKGYYQPWLQSLVPSSTAALPQPN
jgi:hypothetical protein